MFARVLAGVRRVARHGPRVASSKARARKLAEACALSASGGSVCKLGKKPSHYCGASEGLTEAKRNSFASELRRIALPHGPRQRRREGHPAQIRHEQPRGERTHATEVPRREGDGEPQQNDLTERQPAPAPGEEEPGPE